MALDTVPWFIGGGAEHSPAVARRLAYSATGGSNGVATAIDLRVLELDVPGTAVRILPGGAIVLNQYPGGQGQTYIANNSSATELQVPATGSESGAVSYVIIKIDDPDFTGNTPADPVNGPYVSFELVSSITGLAYPHVVLAKIDQPASTGTITQDMITDMRKVANPRTESDVFPLPTTSGGNTYYLTSTEGERFPPFSAQTVTVPAWATRMQIRTDWISVKYLNTTRRGENYVKYGPTGVEAETTHFQWDPAENGTTGSRDNWIMADDVAIPEAWRGGTISLRAWGRIVAGSGGEVAVDPGSGLLWDIRFLEVAE